MSVMPWVRSPALWSSAVADGQNHECQDDSPDPLTWVPVTGGGFLDQADAQDN